MSLQPFQTADVEVPTLVLSIRQSWHPDISDDDLYEVTRSAWVVGQRTRETVEVAWGVVGGVIRSVYAIDSWFECEDNRWGFDGHVDRETQDAYLGKDIQDLLVPALRNPIRVLVPR